ncbi:ArnT family glycosyltransferase [Haloarchaeobius sp. DFWS5]|uniref:ArnT family glycosyltransferase n=1 Tax=Haloarchaeobius sp. DFWS5 TaxID=3446114 RepID=UPI003EC12FCA
MSRSDGPAHSTRLSRLQQFLTRRYVPTLLLAATAAVVVFVVATDLFPYHSNNHDEGVYLQQAAMLLDGQLRLHPPATLVDEFRPWFFVVDGDTLYPKYAPVPAAMFAPGLALGVPRLVLAVLAAGTTALVVALGTEAFDRRVGVLSGILLLLSPMFLLTSSVFLPYAPTTFLNLLFALAYVRTVRHAQAGAGYPLAYAILAGLAVALAFFARPFTAVLFALPFVGHACWTLVAATRADGVRLRPHLLRNGIVAVLGICGVLTALAYNWAVTGDPLVFPYEAFAPLDGLGFGERQILDHELDWTPGLAIRTTIVLLWQFAADWTAAGWLGTVAFVGGVGAWLAGVRANKGSPTLDRPHLSDGALRFLLFCVFASVVLGNVYFWGSYNVQAGLDRTGDGLMGLLGPFYHFDLLLPLSVFGAYGLVAVTDRLRSVVASRRSASAARVALLVALVVSVPVVAVAEQAALADPVGENADYTEKYGGAYEPLEQHDFDDALVFVPTAYGDWSNHPFQSLRNDPGFGGDVVFGQQQDASSDFELLDAYPNRTPYRFTYRGEWTPDPNDAVIPHVERLSLRDGERLSGTTRVGVPTGATSAYVRLESGDTAKEFTLNRSVGESVTLEWTLTPDGLRLTNDGVRPLGEGGPVALDGTDELAVNVVFNFDGGATLTYRQEFDARVQDEQVQVLWPPETTVCSLTIDCGTEGTYLPEHPDEHLDGVWINGTLTAGERDVVATTGTALPDRP